MITNPEILSALSEIAHENGGILRPDQVVESARDDASPLHDSFCWDDTKAAHEYRLQQARHLIRVVVKMIDVRGNERPVRVFVSLTTDREEDGGGYRHISSVLSHAEHRKQLIQDALDEMTRFQAKYAELKELSELFKLMSSVRKQLSDES